MNPTDQQAACVSALETEDVLKVTSCAGSGKTSLLKMMARAFPRSSIYLAFNTTTASEARAEFPDHVECRTTHSVAFAACGVKISKKLSRPQGGYVNVAYTGSEIARYFKIDTIQLDVDTILPSGFVGILIRETVAKYEQSADNKLEVNHIPHMELAEKCNLDSGHIRYVKTIVLKHAKKLWAERINPASKVMATHDTYLKLFQLSKPVFEGKEIVYVDEIQDVTPCVHDIILQQVGKSKVVGVGDAAQSIYQFRGAVNAMELLDWPERKLTKSFRFGQAVADVATAVLDGRMEIQGNENIISKAGLNGVVDRTKPYTRIFRTNSALLYAAIEEIGKGTEVSIAIDVRDFVKLLQSAEALLYGRNKDVKHDKLLPFHDWDEMVGESKKDAELGRIVRVTKEGLVSQWIATLQGHKNAANPLVLFTSAHKSKGLQYPQVIVENDFKSCLGESGEWVGLSTPEQNLLYVALTRAELVLEYNLTTQEYLSRHKSEVNTSYDKYVDKQISLLKKDMEFA